MGLGELQEKAVCASYKVLLWRRDNDPGLSLTVQAQPLIAIIKRGSTLSNDILKNKK